MTARHAYLMVAAVQDVASTRERVLLQVTAWGVGLEPEQRDAIKLVTSELVTNALVHGGSPVSVGLYLDDGQLVLVVHDPSPRLPTPTTGSSNEESGRGLLLVDAFASRHGWSRTEHGKKVWAAFDGLTPEQPARRSPVARRTQIAWRRTRLYAVPHGPALARP